MAKKKEFVKLAQRGTIFHDPSSGFSLSGDEVKPLPPRVGQVLKARIRTGAIIFVDKQGNVPEEKPPEKEGDK